MLLKNGSQFRDTGFKHNNVQYPANYAAQHRDEWDALGITEVIPDPQPDPRWSISTLNWATGKWTSTPRDLGEVKERLVREAKQRAFSLLAPSDWRAIKEAETDEPIAEDWMEYRDGVRTRCNEIEEAVSGAETLEDLMEVDTGNWPDDPLTIKKAEERAAKELADQERAANEEGENENNSSTD